MTNTNAADTVGKRYRVTGKVQGVFFRASTRDVALTLGMSGHAHNLEDGSVEVVAIGSLDAHARLERWLEAGPPAADVLAVRSEAVRCEPARGFVIG